MHKLSSPFITILLICLFTSSCGGNPQELPIPTVSSTPTPVPTFIPSPTLIFTPMPTELSGIGVSREKVQLAYEELSLTFDEPTVENGVPTLTGHIVLNDLTAVGVFLIGEEENLQEASVTILLPKMLLTTPESSAKQHGKVLFVMQVLLDAVFPEWKESASWLDESFRSFDGNDGKKATAETVQRNNIVTFEVELPTDQELSDYISVSLTIRAK